MWYYDKELLLHVKNGLWDYSQSYLGAVMILNLEIKFIIRKKYRGNMSGKNIYGIFLDGILCWEYWGVYPNTTPSSRVWKYGQMIIRRRVEKKQVTCARTGSKYWRTWASIRTHNYRICIDGYEIYFCVCDGTQRVSFYAIQACVISCEVHGECLTIRIFMY